MKKILVVGKNSFLATRFRVLCTEKHSYQFVSHGELDSQNIYNDVSCIINFALHPGYVLMPHSPELDIDLKIASAIAGKPIHYIMISSRMVYGTQVSLGANEKTLAEGLNEYGKNKIITEKKIATLLKNNLTILRLANFLAYEPPSNGHVSFMQRLAGSLKTSGRIVYDISPFVRKDFIIDKAFSDILEQVCHLKPSGVFNVGSGIPLPVGQIALWVLEGYGSGELLVTSPRVYDEFFLNVEKITNSIGIVCTTQEIRDYCISLGKRIKYE